MREVHEFCDKHRDIASLIEVLIDEAVARPDSGWR